MPRGLPRGGMAGFGIDPYIKPTECGILYDIPSFVTSYAKCGNTMLSLSLLTSSVAAEPYNICSLLQFNRSVIFIIT